MTQTQIAAPANSQPRYDIYMAIHKALRAYMSETLEVLGRMDIEDAGEFAAALAQVRELLDICEGHLLHENRFVHAAMEQRQPGSAAHIAAEHVDHERDIEQLRYVVDALEASSGLQRRVLALGLYREVALFVAHNFEHMQREESDHNAVLWSVYNDAELIELEAALKASIPPQEMAIIARWMLTANDHAFRVAMLSGARAHAPAPVFDMLLAIAKSNLCEGGWRKLANALELPVAA